MENKVALTDKPEPLKLYSLSPNKIPTVETLGLKKHFKRSLPVTRILNDDVLITIEFSSKKYKLNLFCSYSNSLSDTAVFCLWTHDKTGVNNSIEIFKYCSLSNYPICSLSPQKKRKENV